jgi:hypothetical protein
MSAHNNCSGMKLQSRHAGGALLMTPSLFNVHTFVRLFGACCNRLTGCCVRSKKEQKTSASGANCRADGLKIYPTLVIRGTGLYELWKKGLYKNYPPERLVDLISRVLALVPPWVRVYRIQRDIPMPLVTSGVEKGLRRHFHSSTCTHGNG